MSRIKWNLEILEQLKQKNKMEMDETESIIYKGREILSSMTEEVWEGEDGDMARNQLYEIFNKEMVETWRQLDDCKMSIHKAQDTAFEAKNFCNELYQIFQNGTIPADSDSSPCGGDVLCDLENGEILKTHMENAGKSAESLKSNIEMAESILAELETDEAKYDYTSYTEPIKRQAQNVIDREKLFRVAVTRYDQKVEDMDRAFSSQMLQATPDIVPEPVDTACLQGYVFNHFNKSDIVDYVGNYETGDLGDSAGTLQIQDIFKMLFDRSEIDINSLSDEDIEIAFLKLSKEEQRAMLLGMGMSIAEVDSILDNKKKYKAHTLGSLIRASVSDIMNRRGRILKKDDGLEYGAGSELFNGIRRPYAEKMYAEDVTGSAGNFGTASKEKKQEYEEKQDEKSYETLMTQYEFSEEEMLYLSEYHPELIDQLYDAYSKQTSDIERKYEQVILELFQYHVKQLTNDDGSLKMDEICAYMYKEPLDVTKSEYLALCELFNRMDQNPDKYYQREQFIRSGFKCEKVYTDYSTTGGGSGYYRYTRSETFEMFANIYFKTMGIPVSDFSSAPLAGETTNDVDDRISEANRIMNNYNLLYTATHLIQDNFSGGTFCNAAGLNMHDDGDTLKISINNIGDTIDFRIKTYAKNKVTTTIESDIAVYDKKFTIYKFNYDLGSSFDKASSDVAEGLRVDVDNIAMQKVVDFLAQEILLELIDGSDEYGIKSIPCIGPMYSLLMLYNDIQKEKEAARRVNAAADTIQYDNIASSYLSKINCAGTLIVDQEGKTYITSYNYNMDKLKQRIDEYNSLYPENKVEFNEDTFINDLLTNEEYRNSLDPEGSSTSFFDYWDEQENACGDQNVNVTESGNAEDA